MYKYESSKSSKNAKTRKCKKWKNRKTNLAIKKYICNWILIIFFPSNYKMIKYSNKNINPKQMKSPIIFFQQNITNIVWKCNS